MQLRKAWSHSKDLEILMALVDASWPNWIAGVPHGLVTLSAAAQLGQDIYSLADSLLKPMLFSNSGTALEALCMVSDVFAWAACTMICVILIRPAWKLRQRISFPLTGGMLAVVIVGVL